jgi:hypothetical protein
LFFVTSLGLAYLATQRTAPTSLLEGVTAPQNAAPAPPTDAPPAGEPPSLPQPANE